MRSKALFLMSLLAGASLAPALAAGALRAAPPGVSLSQIVEKHVAARGGGGQVGGEQSRSRAAPGGLRRQGQPSHGRGHGAGRRPGCLKLKLTLRNGDVQHIWIDAKSFLDVKVEGLPRRMDGKMRAVWINQRDFRSVHGVMVPYLYETANEGNPRTHKMVIEAVEVNRTLDDARFAKPQALVAATPPAAAPATPAATKR